MAESKEELLQKLTKKELRQLAKENDVELQGEKKDDLVQELAASRKVTKTSILEYVDEDEGESDTPAVAPVPGSASDTTPPANAADEASPTGGENVAGTAQKVLSAAPPMTDPSGSNIPYPNLRQPLAEGADPAAGASKVTADSLDPATVDPVGTAKARVEGRTSDAANRSADVRLADVPPDQNDGPKQSDAGPDLYPFPPQGDVDVATVDPGSGKGEYFPNLEVDDWVVLDGNHDLVPDRFDGRRAIVVDAPRYLVPQDKKDEVWITVRTRDEANATLNIPLAAVKEVQKGGLALTHRG